MLSVIRPALEEIERELVTVNDSSGAHSRFLYRLALKIRRMREIQEPNLVDDLDADTVEIFAKVANAHSSSCDTH